MPNWTDDNGVSHFNDAHKTQVFVFGSNRQGRHGKGAALEAKRNWGAIQGQAQGRQGNAYAIVTKELRPSFPPVTLQEIAYQLGAFHVYAAKHPELTFILTRIGCGLAGFSEADIKPLCKLLPSNVKRPAGW